MSISKQNVLDFISLFNDKMAEHRQELTQYDQAIGDGDHGINMNRGMLAVMEAYPTFEEQTIPDIFKAVGTTLLSKVGGASGPLYGTAFRKMGVAVKAKENELEPEDISAMIDKALDGIQKLGKAVAGEKTMLDALIPAKEAYAKALADGKSVLDALTDAETACWEGVEYTKTIIATKGRASYVGERGIGHQDPGATSMSYLFQAAKEAAQKAQ